MKTVQEIRIELERAREQAEREGYRLARGITVETSDKTCCILGTVLITCGRSDGHVEDAAHILGLTKKEGDAIANGFDGDCDEDFGRPDLLKLGREFGTGVPWANPFALCGEY